VKHISRD